MSEETVLPVGIHPGVPFATYLDLPFASHSSVRTAYDRSLEHCRWEQMNPRDATPAMAVGSALHCLALTPDLYEEEVTVLDMASRGNKAYKALREDNPRGVIILTKEDDTVHAMRDSMMSRPHIARLFAQDPEDRELTLRWDLETRSGRVLRCKSRLDLPLLGAGCITDLKTCEDASSDAFERNIRYNGYGTQASFYLYAAWALGMGVDTFAFLAIERKPPYGCRIHQLSDAVIEKAWHDLQDTLSAYAEAMDTGVWPGYSDAPNYIDVPPWDDTYSSGGDLPEPIGEDEEL